MERQPSTVANHHMMIPWPFAVIPALDRDWQPLLLESHTPTHLSHFEGEGWGCDRSFIERSMDIKLTLDECPSFTATPAETAIFVTLSSLPLVRSIGFDEMPSETEESAIGGEQILINGPEFGNQSSGLLTTSSANSWSFKARVAVNLRSYIEDVIIEVRAQNLQFDKSFANLTYADLDRYIGNRFRAI